MSLEPIDESQKRKTRKSWPRKRKKGPRIKRTDIKTIAETVARKVALGVPLNAHELAWQEMVATLNEEAGEGEV